MGTPAVEGSLQHLAIIQPKLEDLVTTPDSYKTLASIAGWIGGTGGVNTYWVPNDGSIVASATGAQKSITGAVYFQGSELTSVLGKTPMLRVLALAYNNGTQIGGGVSVSASLYSFLAGGAANLFTPTLSIVNNTTVTFTNPAANSRNQSWTSDFAVPTDGHYCLGLAIAGNATAANSLVSMQAYLQLRYV